MKPAKSSLLLKTFDTSPCVSYGRGYLPCSILILLEAKSSWLHGL